MSSASSSRSSSPELESKKRKRASAAAAELEIDVSLPEPPSKKALRRAKKGKSTDKQPTAIPYAEDAATIAAGGNEDDSKASATAADPAKRSVHGIWIGNLPFTADKAVLRTFLTEHASIPAPDITRIHMPTPNPASVDARQRIKPQNKGFAYVDFSTREALESALKLSETLLTGRRVLIKDAKSFEGRPEKTAATPADGAAGAGAGRAGPVAKPASKRVFVGNLGFDVTKEDLEEHFGQAGTVEDIHMATFEDSGKCKGFAWVRFVEIEAAECAVKGWVFKQDDHADSEESASEESASDDGAEKAGKSSKKRKPSKKSKGRKWFINRLQGRPLRCEFAEDASVRYKKRFGKDRTADGQAAAPEGDAAVTNGDVAAAPPKRRRMGGDKDERQEQRRRKHVDARTIKPGAALANAPRASGAIVEGSGKKTTFDD